MPTHSPRLVIFGYGNPSRGDDALGAILLARAEAISAGVTSLDCALVEDFQLQVEHALDLAGRDLALFIDAAEAGPAPFSFRRLVPAEDPTYTTHSISPESVLHTFRKLHGTAPPPAYVLAVRGSTFELGEDLSEDALRNLDSATAFLNVLLGNPSRNEWDRLTTGS